jgi:hypothetical protein
MSLAAAHAEKGNCFSVCDHDIGAYASGQYALQANSDHRTYRPCLRRDYTSGTSEIIYSCYRFWAASLSVMISDWIEQLADVGRSNSATAD